jgi:DNA-binding response OmpR family regulator
MRVAIHPPDASPELVRAVVDAGYRPVPVEDAAAVAEMEPADGWSLVVVELGEQPLIGLAVARRVRDDGTAPVLVVAPRPLSGDIPGGVFDDFIVAPVDPAELAIRASRLAVGSVGIPPDEVVAFKDLSLNLATYQATVGHQPIDLTYMEYELSRVWGYDYFGGARTVDVHVRRLRAKLGEERSSWITTVRSVGYRFG